ncbi:hypothetical protein HHL22_22175 [Hymenobacter sp. RP-2-7]|uniref:Uncharacterized protein n=1 Tax=Hymenobacter polaris TaxID=2682546 RepID=A0A7Y0FPC5_9BACT|nr:hypothetical protein [Hymenobacter polaris]NML67917.1 hypothetical protein [Hymenobacter polaris]
MSKHPSSSKPLEDLRKDLEEQEADSFKEHPGAPLDKEGKPITNLSLSEFDNMGGKVIAGPGSNKKIHDINRLTHKYERSADAVQKVASKSSAGLELRIYRDKNTGEILEKKTKVSTDSDSTGSKPEQARSTPSKEPSRASKPEATMSHNNPTKENSRVAEMKKQAGEMTGSAAREQARAEKEKASRDKVAAMKNHGKELTERKDKITTMREAGGELTGSESRRTKDSTESLKTKFRDNARETTKP